MWACRALWIAGIVGVCGLACSCSPERKPAQRILLVTIDTLRWDRLGYVGYDVKTPNLDRLAGEGTVFTQAITAAPLTLPSHASMFTGLYPPSHEVRNNGMFRLEDDFETMAEVLKREGYDTAAFVGAFVVDRRFGLAQGFDHYDDELPEENPVHKAYYPERPAEEVVLRASEWIRGRGEAPFFAWVHVFDPHAPYNPPSPFQEQYPGRPYDGEIAYTDHALGPLIELVDGMEKSLIVVTSDHGESLGAHGESTHGLFIYDATTRVPLVMKGAGVPSAHRVEFQVRTVDIAPSVLELAGASFSRATDGISLVPHLASDSFPVLSAYAESFLPRINLNWSELRFLRKGGLKYIDAPRAELYDLSADPDETHNLWNEAPSRGRDLAGALSEIAEADSLLTPTVELDAETARRLERLGYLTSMAVDAGEERDRPDPKDRIDVYERVQDLLASELPPEQVIAEYRAILELEPANALVRVRLANRLAEEDRLEEALQEYRELLRVSEIDFRGLENLSAGLLLLGRTDEALSATEMAVAVAPWNPDFQVLRGEALEQAGRIDEAREAYSAALELEAKAETFWSRGVLAEKLGEVARAEADFREALKRDQTLEHARVALARLLTENGRVQEAEELLRSAPDGVDRSSPEMRSAFAEAHLAKGEYEEAKALLEAARRDAPENTRVLALLGPLYGREGKLELAEATLEKALELGETVPEVRRNLAVVYMRQGRGEAAIDQLRLATEDDPEDPSSWYSLGNANLQARRNARAADAFERALELRPDWPEAAFNLGLAAERAGRTETAAEAFRRFLAVGSPSDTRRRAEAEKRLERLKQGS